MQHKKWNLEELDKWGEEKGIHLLPGQIYESRRKEMKWECSQGHHWEASLRKLLVKDQCPICVGIWKASILDHSKYELVGGQSYTHNKSPLLWWCPLCQQEFNSTWNSIQQGRGCPSCAQRHRIEILTRNKLVHQDILVKIEGKPLIPLELYRSCHVKMKWECLNCHGVWEAKWNDIRNGHGCPYCLKKRETAVGHILEELFPSVQPQHQINCPTHIRKSGKIYVDFFIPELCLIVEYQGEQHYQDLKYMKSPGRLEAQKHRDDWLRSYCSQNKILLLEVPFWEQDLRRFILQFLKSIEV